MHRTQPWKSYVACQHGVVYYDLSVFFLHKSPVDELSLHVIMNPQGLVELCLRAAALQDPDNLAWRPGSSPEQQAALRAREACYKPMMQVGQES